jgi:hypothetical protein
MRGTGSRNSFDVNSGTSQNRQKALVVPTYPLAPTERL